MAESFASSFRPRMKGSGLGLELSDSVNALTESLSNCVTSTILSDRGDKIYTPSLALLKT